ncbi:MAG: flagellar hook-length control protein FliK [Plesiomonas sp.]|uniref:flagellar hook-length control protein FliK n=1 Tax=Plesiomonas sp. TaxID=2486279 RepID=UPI003F37072F
MTLNAIPTASPSVPTQGSASSSHIKHHSETSTSSESGRDFSDCLSQSDFSSVTPSNSCNKPIEEKNSDKKSDNAEPDTDSAQQVLLDNLACVSCENTTKIDLLLSGSSFSSADHVADSETLNVDVQEADGNAESVVTVVNTGSFVNKTMNGEGSAVPGSMISAQDDPWLQQIDANRKALQSSVVDSGDMDEVNSTGKAGVTGSVEHVITANRHVLGAAEGVQAVEEGSADQLSIDDLSTHKDRATDAHSPKMALRAESSSKLHSETDLARQSALLFTEDSQQKSSDQSIHSADRLSRLSALSSMGNEAPVVTPPAQGHDLLAALRQQNAVSARQAEHVQTPNTPLPLRIAEQSAQVLHEQVQFLLNRKLDTVEIRLDPPELGNLQIKLQLNQDQAQVGIIVHNTQARELLEQTLPRLREMLAQQGIMLGQTQIQQQQQGQAHDQQARGGQAGSGEQATQTPVLHTTGDIETELLPQKAVSISPYQVDYYA